MSLREQHQASKRQSIRKAIDALRGDNAYNNLECTLLGAKRFSDAEEYIWEALAEVQDEWLPHIGDSAIAYLEEKLDRKARNR